MATNVIVSAEAEHQEAPERATVHLRIGMTGHDRDFVHNQTQSTLQDIKANIEQLRGGESPAATWHAISGVNTWSYNSDQGMKWTEQVSVKVKFRDFTALGDWLNGILVREAITLDYIEWTLTNERRKALNKELRQKAVQLAKEKAEQYAEAAGLHISSLKTVADTGFIANRGGGGSNYFTASRGGALAKVGGVPNDIGLGDSYEFAPEDVKLNVSVDAEFIAE